jgi:hypothetical protein
MDIFRLFDEEHEAALRELLARSSSLTKIGRNIIGSRGFEAGNSGLHAAHLPCPDVIRFALVLEKEADHWSRVRFGSVMMEQASKIYREELYIFSAVRIRAARTC